MNVLDALEPGDLLLFSRKGFFSRLIRIKTWSSISHCSIYIGAGKTVASRDGKGVELYDLQPDGLAAVLRPTLPVDLPAALDWFAAKAKGQRYDFLGLLRFFTLGKQSTDKQFCSEFATRFYRAGGFEPFYADIDADLVAPGQFLYSPRFSRVLTSPSAV
jgi:hypothetical protein